jgi:8-oxo-dGTP diphosphatase
VDWSGDDTLRPLESEGRRQSRRLARLLPCFAPEQIVSADRVRCVQTVEPTAEFLGLPIEIRPAFSDEAYSAEPDRAVNDLLELVKAEPSTVLCSQGEAIPALLEAVAPRDAAESFLTRKAAMWVLSFADGIAVAADYYEDAVR